MYHFELHVSWNCSQLIQFSYIKFAWKIFYTIRISFSFIKQKESEYDEKL